VLSLFSRQMRYLARLGRESCQWHLILSVRKDLKTSFLKPAKKLICVLFDGHVTGQRLPVTDISVDLMAPSKISVTCKWNISDKILKTRLYIAVFCISKGGASQIHWNWFACVNSNCNKIMRYISLTTLEISNGHQSITKTFNLESH